MSDRISGGCHCGNLRFEAEGEAKAQFHCQCANCAKLSNTGHASLMIVSSEGFSATGEIGRYEFNSDSDNVITRHFCPRCGTGVYNSVNAYPGIVFLMASGLDDPERFQPNAVLFTSSAPSWDVIGGELDRHERGF